MSTVSDVAGMRTLGTSPIEVAARDLMEHYDAECRRSTWPSTSNDCDPSIPAKVKPQTTKVWAEIERGERSIRYLVNGRWRAVGALLQSGTARSWDEIGAALGVTGGEARRDFCAWVAEQHITHRRDWWARRDESTGLIEWEAMDLLGYAAELPVSTGGAL